MPRNAELSGMTKAAPPGDDTPWHVQANGYSVPPYFHRKAVLDRVLAALLLVPGLPMIGLLILLVRLTSRGPGIYRQIRVGQRGRTFAIYKIRTVQHDIKAAGGRDPRIIPMGMLLRRLHLHELPQLLNILKGDMSLVGPQPERPEIVHVLAEAIPGYLDRLAVPPGVTGLAQLNLPPDSDLISVRRKLALDREYIEQAGLLLDMRLLCFSSLRMLKLPERWMLPIFGLRRNVPYAAMREETSGNGKPGSQRKRPGKHSHGSNGRQKPR
jgi:lipopolysaccharide/colanic/teichoic acid biosynthesis glycosyltransferase